MDEPTPLKEQDSNSPFNIDASVTEHPATESENVPTVSTEVQPEERNSVNSEEENNSDNQEVTGNESKLNEKIPETQNVSHSLHMTQGVINLSTESLFTCKFPGCSFTSTDVELYLKHEDTHVNGGSFDCDICSLNFPSYANMRRHLLYTHQGIRTFECQHCSKRFLRKDQFMEHLVSHSKPRPYQCDICGSTFSYRFQLKSHVNGEHFTMFTDKSCSLCDFKASSPSEIKIHYATFHLKQNTEETDENRAQDLVRRVPVAEAEKGAIDLATVSQNFSFVAAHFPSYSNSVHETNAILPGPSDLSRTSNVIRIQSPIAASILPSTEQPAVLEESRHTCCLPASTTILSPPSLNRCIARPEVQYVNVLKRIKIETTELSSDDGQSGNVQPTSTMDLSAGDVVGTTCMSNEAEAHFRRKAHRHSSEEIGSEGNSSPSSKFNDERQAKPRYRLQRYRPYEEGSCQSLREHLRHTCGTQRHYPERLHRCSNDSDRSGQNDNSDNEDRKIFFSCATSTNAVSPSDSVSYSRHNHASSHHGEAASESHSETNFYASKNTIVIRDIESCTLTCIYCDIIFPDQTLYLLHRSLHSEGAPWKCNLCGKICNDKYDFNSHVISKGHY